MDMQLEHCKQENDRLKTQMGHLTRDLWDRRAALSNVSLSSVLFQRVLPMRGPIFFLQERERAASVAATDAQYTELVEKIQQLNFLR